jgi:7-cyano-7-deazaguanine reductase
MDSHGTMLGRSSDYPTEYAPTLLEPLPRAAERARLGCEAGMPFGGVDIWNAYELSWLDSGGKPAVATAELRFPAQSRNIIESKSLKLYLNSLSGVSFAAPDAVRSLIEGDLSRASGCAATVELRSLRAVSERGLGDFPGTCIDELQVAAADYEPNPDLLRVVSVGRGVTEETLHSHLFKSNCPVTAQPDWASVLVRYRGHTIDRRGLLLYLISYRNHAAFHEHCVERIFMDILRGCEPERLTVYARFTRRGGVDINPFRSNFEPAPQDERLARQ